MLLFFKLVWKVRSLSAFFFYPAVDGSTRGADPVTINEAQYYDTHL